jgi:hypothetical protein
MNIDDIKQRYEPRDAKVFNKNNSALKYLAYAIVTHDRALNGRLND